MTALRRTCCAAALVLSPAAAFAACATDAEVDAFVAAWEARETTPALAAGGTMEDAACTAGKVRAAMEGRLGPVIGYKAGLTSEGTMKAFGVAEPVMGVLYRDMMLEDGATVPAAFGARPLFEADLILVVADDGINDATTHEEALAHVSEVRPFIELPDIMYAEGEPLDGVTITASGVAVRAGVLGAAIPVEDPAAMAETLASMTVRVVGASGEELAAAPGASVLGNPVESVLWLRSKGVTFAPGDMISVGSIGPLLPTAKAPGGATVTYEGLPGDPSVSVVFE